EDPVKEWIEAHQKVLDEAKVRFGCVVPMGFDTILFAPDGDSPPDEVVEKWLEDDYSRLQGLLEKMHGRDEYGVQVFYTPKVFEDAAIRDSEALRKMREEIASKSPGIAYMYRQKLEMALKDEVEALVGQYFHEFHERISSHCEEMVVGKIKKTQKNNKMFLNVYCLVPRDGVDGLGEELEKVQAFEGITVRFTGPWPPYSFVADLSGSSRNG
ncbi:MAG: GvpL/GvpF family gas vesicle protein, partial [Thermovirgaceae bacterium]|nr:GvpL/GvpF family gas vesicle protein [Thermovirgaceae bacterium]